MTAGGRRVRRGTKARGRFARAGFARAGFARAGFTLAEVVVAVALLSGVLIGFGAFMQRFGRSTTLNAQRSTESDLAVERVEAVKTAASYAGVDAFAVREASVAGYPGYVRQTYVRRTSSAVADHKTVTVVVTNSALRDSVVKTTVITAF